MAHRLVYQLKPKRPGRGSDRSEVDIYQSQIKLFVKEKTDCKAGLAQMFQVIIRVSSNPLIHYLELVDQYEDIYNTSDTISLQENYVSDWR